jgi:hypothetical protein
VQEIGIIPKGPYEVAVRRRVVDQFDCGMAKEAISAGQPGGIGAVFRNVIETHLATLGFDLAKSAVLSPLAVGSVQVGATRIKGVTNGLLLCSNTYDVEVRL